MGVTSLWYRPLPVLLVLMVVGWAQRQQQENPFIIQQQEHRQQMMQKLQLQQLQQAHMDIKPLAAKSTQRSAAERGAPPSHRRQQHAEGRGRKSGVHNRNEMHKGSVGGGPGPTPWTRWTPRPRPRQSPWEGRQTGRADTVACGGRGYNPREHICCHNQLHKRQGLRPACCGPLPFDFVFSLCCNGKITARTAGRPFC